MKRSDEATKEAIQTSEMEGRAFDVIKAWIRNTEGQDEMGLKERRVISLHFKSDMRGMMIVAATVKEKVSSVIAAAEAAKQIWKQNVSEDHFSPHIEPTKFDFYFEDDSEIPGGDALITIEGYLYE